MPNKAQLNEDKQEFTSEVPSSELTQINQETESWDCSALRRNDSRGREMGSVEVLMGRRAERASFSVVSSDSTKDNEIQEIPLTSQKQLLLTVRAVKHWHSLPREVLHPPSLETFKTWPDIILSNFLQLTLPWGEAQDLNAPQTQLLCSLVCMFVPVVINSAIKNWNSNFCFLLLLGG